jgi:hypothetical protein
MATVRTFSKTPSIGRFFFSCREIGRYVPVIELFRCRLSWPDEVVIFLSSPDDQTWPTSFWSGLTWRGPLIIGDVLSDRMIDRAVRIELLHTARTYTYYFKFHYEGKLIMWESIWLYAFRDDGIMGKWELICGVWTLVDGHVCWNSAYYLLFADPGKQISVFRFCLQQINGCSPFPFHFPLVRFLFAEFQKHGEMDIGTWASSHGHGDMDIEAWTLRHGHWGIDMEAWTWRHGHGVMDMETWTWRHGHGDMESWRNGDIESWRHGDIKRKTEAQTIFLNLLLFAHRANGSLSFVRLLMKNKRKLSVCKQT